MDNVTKAIALAGLGIKVFPVDTATRRPIIPESKGGRGFYDATSDDFELIATWFTLDYPEETTEVAVWTGGSGLVVLDIDKGKNNGKNGFESIKAAGLADDLGKTEHYRTKSGGQHHIFQSDRIDLTLDADVMMDGKRLEGVDIRAGGSYFVWWGDTVPESRDAFSADIPEWIVKAAETRESEFTGEGFSGSVTQWLDTLPDDVLPSGRVNDFVARIPVKDFGHPEMVDLVWSLVRMGSERETGIRTAMEKLRAEWLRHPYDTPGFRRDFDLALRGAIFKAGRVQTPVPPLTPLSPALKAASDAGVGEELRAMERKVSETDTEIDLSRMRKEMFRVAASGGLTPSVALGIVTGSKAFKLSKVNLESAWFGDGETFFHEVEVATVEEEIRVEESADPDIELKKLVKSLSADAESFSFLTKAEKKAAEAYDWWGKDYLDWAKAQLKHFNKPYHVGAMWAALSVIASPWGKVPLPGADPTDCNLYFNILGSSSSGKSEAWGFGKKMIDVYYGREDSPIVGDTKKTSALSLHRTLILRDGKPSLVYSDEVQAFFLDLQTSHWQGSLLGDLSDYYGGEVAPKNTMNDKEISGKRARSLLTTYLTGIADMSLESINLNQWKSGLFYRFLWGFGEPRKTGDFDVVFVTGGAASYTTQMEKWKRELQRVQSLQEMKWGPGRIVLWEEDARKRMSKFLKHMDEAVEHSPLYEEVFVAANGRFGTSIMKCATLIAMAEASETVKLEHVLVALNFAGPWHRSMVLAVGETGKEKFEREVEKCFAWIKRNAIRQVGKPGWIQRNAVMRAFRPNESADRMLRQLTEEGWLVRSGDRYELSEG